jgi:hypothetical protein
MSTLSPAAQAVASAYDDTPEKDTGNHRYLWLAAAIRAAADQVVPTDALYARSCCEFTGEGARAALLAIAAELENS